jgi:superfamily I DNA/RNA helicase
LEFPVVFIAGVEEGLLPCALPGFSRGTGSDVEEERRLFYVGMTRAKENLILSCSATRSLFGELGNRGMSRFIEEIPPHLLASVERGLKKKKIRQPVQLRLFK